MFVLQCVLHFCVIHLQQIEQIYSLYLTIMSLRCERTCKSKQEIHPLSFFSLTRHANVINPPVMEGRAEPKQTFLPS